MVGSENVCILKQSAKWPFKVIQVIDFGTNRKRVCNFLLVVYSNFDPILPLFGDRDIKKSDDSFPYLPKFFTTIMYIQLEGRTLQ